MSEVEEAKPFLVEDFFNDCQRGVVTKLYENRDDYTLVPSLVGGLLDEIRGNRHALALETTKKRDLVEMIRRESKGSEEKGIGDEPPCEVCSCGSLHRNVCAPRCSELIDYVKSLPVRAVSKDPPCQGCYLENLNKNICAVHCPTVRAIQQKMGEVSAGRSISLRNGGYRVRRAHGSP